MAYYVFDVDVIKLQVPSSITTHLEFLLILAEQHLRESRFYCLLQRKTFVRCGDIQACLFSIYSGDSTGALTRGTRYTGQDLTFDLPAGADVCDISTFTIWCEDFDVFFTELLIPTSTFVSLNVVVF